MNRKMRYLVTSMAFIGFVACAQSQVERDVDYEVSKQPLRPMQGGVALKGLDSIESSKVLTMDQKQKMRELHERMMKDTFKNQEETSKLKSVLFETITATPYNHKKVSVIRNRLIELNTRKLNSMFSALFEVEQIIGYESRNQKEDYYSDVIREILNVDK